MSGRNSPEQEAVVRCPFCRARLDVSSTGGRKAVRCAQCGRQLGTRGRGAVAGDEYDMVGRTVEDCRIRAPFRQDSASVLYKALTTEGGDTVALRVLKPKANQERVSLRSLAERIRKISSLNVPGLVAFAGEPGWLDGHIVLKERFLPSASLHRHVVQKRLAKLKLTVDIVAAVAEALAPLHEGGVSHGMLSWRNVFVVRHDCVKVADAATLCALRLATGGVWRMALGFLEPGFLAPEVIDTGTAVPASDIYSLGVIFYLAVTGRLPYPGTSAREIRDSQQNSEYPRPSDLNPGVPEGVVACMARMLQKNPLQRYATLGDLLDDLDYLRMRRAIGSVGDDPTGAHAPGKVQRAARPLGKDPLVGTVLGNCEILARIGEGAMGVVYKARHVGLGRNVAIKVLAPHLTSNKRYVKRFRREAMTVAQLENENIVQIYNVGQEKGYHFIEIQFIEGEDLSTYLRREKVVKLGDALRIVQQVSRGLKAAHERGVVHRDIKPENIMLTRQREVKISDFGLAETFTKSDRSTSRRPAGTPYYMSPEQCRAEPVDGRSDIYSLGVTFYYMLAGERPHEGPTPAEVMRKHQHEYAKPLREVKATLPEEVCAVVEKMMRKDPAQRYQSCDELLADLDGILERRAQKSTETEGTVSCPHCGKPIRKAAVKCRHCKQMVVRTERKQEYKKCPYCGRRIKAEAKSCLKCGVIFRGLDRLKMEERKTAVRYCQHCGERIHASTVVCPFCAEVVRKAAP